MVVCWRIGQILNKKDLRFWADATKTGAALYTLACCMLAKSIFVLIANEKKWGVSFQPKLKWHTRQFTTADFVILKVVKKRKR